MNSKKVKSVCLLFLTAIIWGFAFAAQRVGSKYVGAFTFIGVRFALGALSLIPVVLIFEKEKFDKEKMKKTFLVGAVCGVILFIASTLQQYGIELTQSAGKSGFITGLYTVLVPIFGFLFLKKKTGVLTWCGAIVAVIGLYLLSINGREKVGIGDLVLLLGALFWALHILIIDKYVTQVSPIKFSQIQFAVCSVIGIICALCFEDITTVANKTVIIPILYAGIMSSGVAFTCQIIGQKDVEPTFAAIILSTESVFSAIGGAIILKETMSGRGYIGCALMFVGIVLSQLNLKEIKEKCKVKKLQ